MSETNRARDSTTSTVLKQEWKSWRHMSFRFRPVIAYDYPCDHFALECRGAPGLPNITQSRSIGCKNTVWAPTPLFHADLKIRTRSCSAYEQKCQMVWTQWLANDLTAQKRSKLKADEGCKYRGASHSHIVIFLQHYAIGDGKLRGLRQQDVSVVASDIHRCSFRW